MENIQLTNNFWASEFACQCDSNCTHKNSDLLDENLLNALQSLRDHLGVSINISSALRCPTHNENEGGVENSTHVRGMACDIYSNHASLTEIYDFINEHFPEYSIGSYSSFIHLDTRTRFPVGRRW